eukprot:RCo024834
MQTLCRDVLPMEVCAMLTNAVGRPLTSEEEQVLQSLSASGMAKLNLDFSRGVDLTLTLSELQNAFRRLKERRAAAAGLLSPYAKSFLDQLPRPWPTEVMVLLAEVPLYLLVPRIHERLGKGEQLADILEELATEHLREHLHTSSLRLASVQHLPMSFRAPSSSQIAAKEDSAMLTLTAAAHCGKPEAVGLSAIVGWFSYPPTNQPVELSGSCLPTKAVRCTSRKPVGLGSRGILKSLRSPSVLTSSSSDGLSAVSVSTSRVRFSEVLVEVPVCAAPPSVRNPDGWPCFDGLATKRVSVFARALSKCKQLKRKLSRTAVCK